MKPIISTTHDITTTPAIAAMCCYAPVRLISTNLNRRAKPFLFKFFAGWLKLFSLIINELGNTFKNSSKYILISQIKSSIFVPSKSMKALIKTKKTMKSTLKTSDFQSLDLTVGERASNDNTYPKKSLVVVECIKDFDTAPNADYIINNATEFVKVIERGMIGLSTSHLISSGWVAEDVRFN